MQKEFSRGPRKTKVLEKFDRKILHSLSPDKKELGGWALALTNINLWEHWEQYKKLGIHALISVENDLPVFKAVQKQLKNRPTQHKEVQAFCLNRDIREAIKNMRVNSRLPDINMFELDFYGMLTDDIMAMVESIITDPNRSKDPWVIRLTTSLRAIGRQGTLSKHAYISFILGEMGYNFQFDKESYADAGAMMVGQWICSKEK